MSLSTAPFCCLSSSVSAVPPITACSPLPDSSRIVRVCALVYGSDHGVSLERFTVQQQGLHRGCILAPLQFNIFFAHTTVAPPFSGLDPDEIVEDTVRGVYGGRSEGVLGGLGQGGYFPGRVGCAVRGGRRIIHRVAIARQA